MASLTLHAIFHPVRHNDCHFLNRGLAHRMEADRLRVSTFNPQ